MSPTPIQPVTGRDVAHERDSTSATVIAADKVAGTAVYSPNGDHLGKIETVILDKTSGRVVYAVLSFGGFLGIGQSHYPLPWSVLTYDPNHGGYVVNLAKEALENAPHYDIDAPQWEDRAWAKSVHDHYAARPYWM